MLKELPNQPVICITPHKVMSSAMSHCDCVLNAIWTPHFIAFLPKHPLSFRQGLIKTPPIWNKTPSLNPLTPTPPVQLQGFWREGAKGGGVGMCWTRGSRVRFMPFWVCLMANWILERWTFFQIIILISATLISSGRTSFGRVKSLQVTHMDEVRHLKGDFSTVNRPKEIHTSSGESQRNLRNCGGRQRGGNREKNS